MTTQCENYIKRGDTTKHDNNLLELKPEFDCQVSGELLNLVSLSPSRLRMVFIDAL
jgi:hypothetical protein